MSLDIVDWLDAEGTPESHAARDEIERLRKLADSLLNELEARNKTLAAERERCAIEVECMAGMRGTGAWVALTDAARAIRALGD